MGFKKSKLKTALIVAAAIITVTVIFIAGRSSMLDTPAERACALEESKIEYTDRNIMNARRAIEDAAECWSKNKSAEGHSRFCERMSERFIYVLAPPTEEMKQDAETMNLYRNHPVTQLKAKVFERAGCLGY